MLGRVVESDDDEVVQRDQKLDGEANVNVAQGYGHVLIVVVGGGSGGGGGERSRCVFYVDDRIVGRTRPSFLPESMEFS